MGVPNTPNYAPDKSVLLMTGSIKNKPEVPGWKELIRIF